MLKELRTRKKKKSWKKKVRKMMSRMKIVRTV